MSDVGEGNRAYLLGTVVVEFDIECDEALAAIIASGRLTVK